MEKSERGAQLYRTITVRPSVNFSNIEEVLVVLVPARPATAEAEPHPHQRGRSSENCWCTRRARRGDRPPGHAVGVWMSTGTRVNFVLVAVVYVALAFGAVTGLLAGTAGGLVQDALANGIVGIGGLSKTIVGFFVGVLGAQFIVSQPMPRFVMFVGATFAHELLFQALYALIE